MRRNCCCFTIGGYQFASAGKIVFKTVKRALQVIAKHFSLTQSDSPVRAFVISHPDKAAAVAPNYQVPAHPPYSDHIIFPDFR